MKLPFKALTSNRAFHAGLKELQTTLLQDSQGKLNWAIPKGLLGNNQAVTRMRHKLINNKTHMLLWDLMTEGPDLYQHRLYQQLGQPQDHGQKPLRRRNRRAASDEPSWMSCTRPVAMTKSQGRRNQPPHQHSIIAVAIVTLYVIALGLKNAGLKNPKINHPGSSRPYATVAHSFDYKKGIYLGHGVSGGGFVGMQMLGYITAARSKYELMERTLQEAWANYLFFWANQPGHFCSWDEPCLTKHNDRWFTPLKAVSNYLSRKGASTSQINRLASRAAGFTGSRLH
ncbi:MAG: hypothetical protein R2857_01930 [Vampirovibrionales bacterium]